MQNEPTEFGKHVDFQFTLGQYIKLGEENLPILARTEYVNYEPCYAVRPSGMDENLFEWVWQSDIQLAATREFTEV